MLAEERLRDKSWPWPWLISALYFLPGTSPETLYFVWNLILYLNMTFRMSVQFEQMTAFRHGKLPGEMTGFLNIYIFWIFFDIGLGHQFLNWPRRRTKRAGELWVVSLHYWWSLLALWTAAKRNKAPKYRRLPLSSREYKSFHSVAVFTEIFMYSSQVKREVSGMNWKGLGTKLF